MPSSFDDAEAAWSVGGGALGGEEEKHLSINLMVHTEYDFLTERGSYRRMPHCLTGSKEPSKGEK